MKINPKTAILALIGVQGKLTAEQKHDIASATMQAAPGGVASAGAAAMGWHLSDFLTIATLFFIVLQIAYLIWKWRRQYLLDKERREVGKLPHDTEHGRCE